MLAVVGWVFLIWERGEIKNQIPIQSAKQLHKPTDKNVFNTSNAPTTWKIVITFTTWLDEALFMKEFIEYESDETPNICSYAWTPRWLLGDTYTISWVNTTDTISITKNNSKVMTKLCPTEFSNFENNVKTNFQLYDAGNNCKGLESIGKECYWKDLGTIYATGFGNIHFYIDSSPQDFIPFVVWFSYISWNIISFTQNNYLFDWWTEETEQLQKRCFSIHGTNNCKDDASNDDISLTEYLLDDTVIQTHIQSVIQSMVKQTWLLK